MTDINRRKMIFAALALSACSGLALACDAQSTSPLARTASAAQTSRDRSRSGAGKPTIVLVHGAWADATGWQEVIPLLQQGGYEVIAVQNPLVSLANDIETTKRVIDARSERGPLVVVGHSYGGAVMTAAAAGNPNVKALVYVAAFAPDAGEAIGPLLEKYPSPLGTALVPDKAGFLYIDASKFRDVFAADVPERETRVMAVAQKPIFGAILGQSSAVAAFAPDAGEAIGPFLEKYPSPLGTTLVPDKAGFLYIDASKFRNVFAADVPERETRVMAVAQKPIFGGILGQSSAVAAWRTVPSWYLVAKQDRAINPELERFYARRMGAKTTEIASSHVAFISRPREVAKIIVEAAETISK